KKSAWPDGLITSQKEETYRTVLRVFGHCWKKHFARWKGLAKMMSGWRKFGASARKISAKRRGVFPSPAGVGQRGRGRWAIWRRELPWPISVVEKDTWRSKCRVGRAKSLQSTIRPSCCGTP